MTIKFSLAIEPFSLNRMYYRDRRLKTAEYRDWELCVLQALKGTKPQEEMAKIRNMFDEKSHALVGAFKFNFPATILFNKQGLISSRAEDLTNIEKPLLDLICLPKIHVQAFPYGCSNLNVDDKYVLRLTSSKTVAKDAKYSVDVSFRIVKLPKTD